MFVVNEDLSIYVTRGDIVHLFVTAEDDGTAYMFQPGDVVRIKVFAKKDCETVVLQKDFPITAETDAVEVILDENDTKIGGVISKPTDYWYEVELNPFSDPQTIIGYDEDGAKVFKLFPEGRDLTEDDLVITPEDIPIVDKELDLTSQRPIENQAVARAVEQIKGTIAKSEKETAAKFTTVGENANALEAAIAVERARIDNLVTAGTVDGELVDLRTGANGEIFGSAGTAVREQFSRQKNILCDTSEYVPLVKGSPVLTVLDNTYVNGTDGIATLSGYSVSYFYAQEKLAFYIESAHTYLTIALLNGDINGKVTAVYRDNTLPTVDAPLEVNSGVVVAISYNNLATFTICHNSAFLGYKTSKAFHLNDDTLKALTGPVDNLRNDTINDDAYNVGDKANTVFTEADGYTNGAGIITDADKAMYKTYYATADRDFYCYFSKVNSNYLSLCLYDGAFPNNFVIRYREAETAVPKETTPLLVKKGQSIAVTVVNGEDFSLCANNSFFATSISDKMWRGINSRLDINGVKKPCVRYSESVGVHSTERVLIYIPTMVGYVGYDFAHVVASGINADNWRIVRAFSCDNNFIERFDITNSGEWEMAIKIEGRDDFIGGSLHGDEVATALSIIVDGIKKSASEMSELAEFSTLRIVESTKMYDPNDSKTQVATHGKEYIFTENGLTLKQLVAWETEQDISTSYMTMFPIYRGNDEYSSLQITDTFYSNDDYIEHDVSLPGALPVYDFKKGVNNATLYSNKSGVCATVEVTKMPDANGVGWFQVSGSEQYNKLYFTCAGHGTTHTTKVGERWETETKYNISVNKGTDI